MQQQELIPHLFRTEFRKIVSVLTKFFGLEYIEAAEDIVSDTFLLAAETWGKKGIPDNPTAWLYTVSKNKAKDYIKRKQVLTKKVTVQIKNTTLDTVEPEVDLSYQNINDSQLQMMFAVCHPSIPVEAQIGLSLRILCGFGIAEISSAFLSNKETINKRLFRAKEKLRVEKIKMEFPSESEVDKRLEVVLTTLYLLFNEGYYSSCQDIPLRKDLCIEAMRLTLLLIQNPFTNKPFVNALLALMCFHASRFDSRYNKEGDAILYDDQDKSLWDKELIQRGEYYLNQSKTIGELSKYHLEAAIAYWHTQAEENNKKWENILQLYNKLLQISYSPSAALNRTYALAKADNYHKAIKEAEKLNLEDNHLYYALLGELYSKIDKEKSIKYFEEALNKVRTETDKKVIIQKINQLK